MVIGEVAIAPQSHEFAATAISATTAAQRFQMTKIRQNKVQLLWFHEFLQIDLSRFESFPFAYLLKTC